ncbi:MAG: sigma 54-interacting transcriptional regulator [Anaerovoracaceae bacterium]
MNREAFEPEKLQYLETFFKNSTDGIYVVDKNGRVLLASPSILEILGASYEELVGIKLDSIIQSGVYRGSPVLETIRTKKVFTGLVKARNGTEIMSTSKPIFNENGELELVITNCRPLRIIDSFYRQFYGERDIKKKSIQEQYRPKLEKELVYKSPKMKKLMKVVDAVADTDSTVIIYGETGTGKGLIAQYFHEKSSRRSKRFVDINCAAIPENLIESELFGYEKGAFTGASSEGKLGLFEIAHEGTLFLDEIGEMPLHLQTKLLKVLDAGYVLRLGGTVYHKVNARVVVATNKDLAEMVRQGKFREDLYYRLNVFNVTMPSLRDREEDIDILSQKIVDELNFKYNYEKILSQKTIEKLVQFDWPGNVRQLRNIIERVYVLSKGQMIDFDSVSLLFNDKELFSEERNRISVRAQSDDSSELTQRQTLREYLEEIEKKYIDEVVRDCGGSITEAAKILGVHRTSLYKKKRDD